MAMLHSARHPAVKEACIVSALTELPVLGVQGAWWDQGEVTVICPEGSDGSKRTNPEPGATGQHREEGAPKPRSSRGVQPTARGPHAGQDGYECGPTQNRKFT